MPQFLDSSIPEFLDTSIPGFLNASIPQFLNSTMPQSLPHLLNSSISQFQMFIPPVCSRVASQTSAMPAGAFAEQRSPLKLSSGSENDIIAKLVTFTLVALSPCCVLRSVAQTRQIFVAACYPLFARTFIVRTSSSVT